MEPLESKSGDGMVVPLVEHFDRALEEATRRLEAKVAHVAERQDVALGHHQQLHAVEHEAVERVRAANTQRYEEAIQALQVFRADVDAVLSQMASRVEFNAHVSMYQERHHELREAARGQADRVRIDLTRELEHEREQRVADDNRIRDYVNANDRSIAEIKSGQKAYAAAATAAATLISIVIAALGILLG